MVKIISTYIYRNLSPLLYRICHGKSSRVGLIRSFTMAIGRGTTSIQVEQQLFYTQREPAIN